MEQRGVSEERVLMWGVFPKSSCITLDLSGERGVKLYTAFASFIDSHTIKAVSADKRKTEHILQAKNVVVATGLRPRYPNIPGSKYGITSDDLFSLSKPPGKTLVVGASYVALECAGLLAGVGFLVDLLIRSKPLKSFDQDCVRLVMKNLQEQGINVIYATEVESVQMDGEKEK
ncbi:pyridine nucleotide-disulfide oxidoreductase, partial [Teladorsagia circumcincta]